LGLCLFTHPSKEHQKQIDAGSRWPAPRLHLPKRLRKAYLCVLFSLLVLGGATFALKAFHEVRYPFAWDDDDGAVWWETVHVTNLRTLYHPIQEYPYFVVPYPPLFHAIAWLATRATGSFLVGGRLVCIFSALGVSTLFGLLVFRVSPRRIRAAVRAAGAAVSALLCYRIDSLSAYMPGIGVDPLAVFLSYLGVFLFVSYAPSAPCTFAAFAIFVAALFTKQTALAAPAACLIACALMNRRRSIQLLVFSALLGVGTLLYLCWRTGGEALRHLFIYNAVQPFSITQLILGLQDVSIRMLPLITLAAISLLPLANHGLFDPPRRFGAWLRGGLRTSPCRRALFVLGIQMAIALLVSLTFGKMGGGNHYFMEWNLACCPLAGLLFVRVLVRWRPSARYTLGGTAVFLLLLLVAVTGFPDSLRRIDSVFRLTYGVRRVQDAEYSSAAAVLKIVQQTPGPVLCENMVVTMKAQKEIPIEPGIQCFLAKAGIWDQSGFLHMISTRQFGVIVMRSLTNGFWTDQIVDAIGKNYLLAGQIGDEAVGDSQYTVYRPRP
jgi:hypothetical protein